MRSFADEPHDDTERGWLIRQERQLLGHLDALELRRQALGEYEATRARLCWNEDRRCDVEEHAVRLPKKPGAVRAKLGRSRHGALWLIARWRALGAILERGDAWGEPQNSLAYDLLGIDMNLRSGDPWSAAGLPDARALVDREIQSLERSLEGSLNRLDEVERSETMAGRPVRPSPTMTALVREIAAAWRRLQTIQKRLEDAGPIDSSAPEASEEPEPTPPPPPLPSPPVPEASRPQPTGNRRARRAALSRQRRS